MSEYVTDEMVEAAGKMLPIHEYRVDIPTWICHCLCGWRAEKPHDVDGYDQHVARLVLEAVAPLIAAKALRDAVGDSNRLLSMAAMNPLTPVERATP